METSRTSVRFQWRKSIESLHVWKEHSVLGEHTFYQYGNCTHLKIISSLCLVPVPIYTFLLRSIFCLDYYKSLFSFLYLSSPFYPGVTFPKHRSYHCPAWKIFVSPKVFVCYTDLKQKTFHFLYTFFSRHWNLAGSLSLCLLSASVHFPCAFCVERW